jgi:3-oxoacyl-[acyl-carrier-protein] synthase III
MPGAQIIDIVTYMPERVINNADFFGQTNDPLADNPFFKGVRERRFASPDYSSEELGTAVLARLVERTKIDPNTIDLILYTCIFSDTWGTNIGTALQHRVGAGRAMIMGVDTNCSSFLTSLNIAKAFIESGTYQRIAIVTVTNFVSRLSEYQLSRRASPLGDGATATLVSAGESTIVASYERSHGEHYGLLRLEPDLVDGQFLNYWERGSGPITAKFAPEMVDRLTNNALELVPDAVKRSIEKAGVTVDDIAMLVTHQPNTFFLDEWRQRIGILPPRTHDTLEFYGNLFHGSIPATLSDAKEKGKLKAGDLVALGTFSNAGDIVSSMVMKWNLSN